MIYNQCYDDDNCNVCLGMRQKQNCHADEVRRYKRKATPNSRIEKENSLDHETRKIWRTHYAKRQKHRTTSCTHDPTRQWTVESRFTTIDVGISYIHMTEVVVDNVRARKPFIELQRKMATFCRSFLCCADGQTLPGYASVQNGASVIITALYKLDSEIISRYYFTVVHQPNAMNGDSIKS